MSPREQGRVKHPILKDVMSLPHSGDWLERSDCRIYSTFLGYWFSHEIQTMKHCCFRFYQLRLAQKSVLLKHWAWHHLLVLAVTGSWVWCWLWGWQEGSSAIFQRYLSYISVRAFYDEVIVVPLILCNNNGSNIIIICNTSRMHS